MSKKQGKVIRNYETPYPEPFVIKKGDKLQTSIRDSEWEGWIWCLKADGKSAWVPEGYLQIQNDDAIALQDYNAIELSVKIGDMLELVKSESGWYWCRDKDGYQGWVPGEYIEVID